MNPFCNILRASGTRFSCSADRNFKAQCNLRTFTSDLDLEDQVRLAVNAEQEAHSISLCMVDIQYFTSGPNFNSTTVDLARIGGEIRVADFCPFNFRLLVCSYLLVSDLPCENGCSLYHVLTPPINHLSQLTHKV